MTDLRDAFRALRATPVVSSVAILSLALGIGANTGMFSIAEALVLRPLPVRHADRLTLLTATVRSKTSDETWLTTSWTNPIWEAIRNRPHLYDGAFAYAERRFDLSQRGQVELVAGLSASGRMFEVLGVQPIAGRVFTEADDRRGGGPDGAVAVISHGFWRRRFGGAPDVVGRTITLERVPFTITGITPPGFFGPEVGRSFDVAVPLGTQTLIAGSERLLDSRSSWFLKVMVRLARGQSPEQATAALRAIQPRIAEETRPSDWRPQDAAEYLAAPFTLAPASTGSSDLRASYERPVVILMGIVTLTLLIACGNIANLLLARANARRHELSVRTALGATGWRLARQLFTESMLLSTVGAALGVVVAHWGSRLVVSQLSTATDQVFLDTAINWRTLIFTTVMAVGTALIFGTVPAFRASRAAPAEAMKDHGRATSSGRRAGLAGVLVVAQVALSLVLLVGAGLFVRTFASLSHVDLGFERDRALVVRIVTHRAGLDSSARREVYERIRRAALALPEVSAAALSITLPVSDNTLILRMDFPGRPALSDRERLVFRNVVSPGFFATLGMPLLAGRDFDHRDRAGGPRAVIVNRAFVEKYFAGENPIGRVITESRDDPNANPRPLEIVGVVGDAIYRSLRTPPPPTMYWPLAQVAPPSNLTLTVRTATSSPALLTRRVADALTMVNPDLTLTFRPLADQVNASITRERLLAELSVLFGALALLLAALGLYGITSYAVSSRRIELGIRMALGTSPVGVVRLVLARLALLVTGGVAIGIAASWWAAKFAETLVFGLRPRDPATMAVAVMILVAIGTVAGWVPARRAARIDPARVLREA